MRKLIILTAALALVASCVTGVRYSPEEIKSYPPNIRENIKEGSVSLGMTQPQVRYAWGMPGGVNVLEPTGKGEFREEWVYTKAGVFKSFLIFTGQKLTEIISSGPGVGKFKVAR